LKLHLLQRLFQIPTPVLPGASLLNSVQSQIDQLITRARNGDSRALGELLEKHRGYLKVLAQRMLGAQLQTRLDASDLVQRTCLSVHKAIGNFQGQTAGQFLAWLQQVHQGNVQNALREHGAQRRNVDQEEEAAEDIASLIADSTQSTPSQRVLRDERAVEMTAALQGLPPDQREAVRLRYLEGLSLKEVGQIMQRSEKAASALILRGVAALRKVLQDKF
jgi:RNA polymerase sigma-70 factor (ECF subfamily)